MSDKIEYSRLLIKRATDTGVVPTISTGTTLSEFTPTDIFEGEFFLNSTDDSLWIRTQNGILQILSSGYTVSNDVTGFTYNNNTFTLTKADSSTLSASIDSVTGLTVNGVLSATTYLNLPVDTYITGGTYNPSTGVATFYNTTGGTFNISGFLTGMTDTYVTGGTYSNGTATFTNSSGGTFNVTGFSETFSGGSGNCITDFYVTNIHGCSPITFKDQFQMSASTASGYQSVALGYLTTSSGYFSLTQGVSTSATTIGSHAEGNTTLAFGDYSHAEGQITTSYGQGSHSEGYNTTAQGDWSHSEGNLTTASGDYSHAEGGSTIALSNGSHSEGLGTTASGYYSHSEGYYTTAIGSYSHSEGSTTISDGDYSHAEGFVTLASGDYSHAEGSGSTSSGDWSHAEGDGSISSGLYSHSEGSGSESSGGYSHAEGTFTTSAGLGSHSEGFQTTAIGSYSHTEGRNTIANGAYSHAEGFATSASGAVSHSEGDSTTASGKYSHAEGYLTQAREQYSHTTGYVTIADDDAQFVAGKYNTPIKGVGAFIVGGGSSTASTRNTLLVQNDEVIVNRILRTTDIQITSGATNGYVLTSDSNGNGTWQPSSTGTTPTLQQVLTQGNTTSGNNIIVSTGDTIYGDDLVLSGGTSLLNITEDINNNKSQIYQTALSLQNYVYDDSTLQNVASIQLDNISSDGSISLFGLGQTTNLNQDTLLLDPLNGSYLKSQSTTGLTFTELTFNDIKSKLESTDGTISSTIELDPFETNLGSYWLASNGTWTSKLSLDPSESFDQTGLETTDGTNTNMIRVTQGGVTMLASDGVDSIDLNIQPTSATITGGVLEYAADYSGNYTNRSLVDKEYVDSVASTGATKGSFGITIDGGGSAITTGVKGYITIPYNATITGWDIFGDVSGSIVVDVWKDTYANFPPTVADTIAGSEKPTLSSAQKNQDTNLTSWTTSVTAGDIIAFNVDSATTVTRVNLIINVNKL